MAKKPAASAATHHCGLCPQFFNSRKALSNHMKNHPDSEPAAHICSTSRPAYVDPDQPQQILREVPELAYDDSTDTTSEMGYDGARCQACKKAFVSGASYTRHALSCRLLNPARTPDSSPETLKAPDRLRYQDDTLGSPVQDRHTMTVEVPAPYVAKSAVLADASQSIPLQTITLNTKQPVQSVSAALSVSASPHTLPASSTKPNVFVCDIKGCHRSYNSEPGLKMHQTDAHGVGGKGLDLYGQDSWMLGQRERERLRAEGLLRVPTGPTRGGNSNRGGNRGGRGGRATPVFTDTGPMRAPLHTTSAQSVPTAQGPYYQTTPQHAVTNTLPLPTSVNIGGVLEMDQAKLIHGKMMRLVLQTDIFIHHDGKMSVGGINWKRISVGQQPEVIVKFDGMCHLPRKLQSLEYIPAPKTLMGEYTAQYPVAEFEGAPDHNPANPGLGLIAVACSKVVLGNGRQDVVKIAAIDILTCRILMSHLVCTDPNAEVAKWCSSATGLTGFKDMEDARQAGYKVLKGWAAARSTLFKFIDKDTIVVGHNLRSELDALRIIHGRAVDVVKVIEKAARGPLSKAQVSLDSWCRDVANIAELKTDPVFGRDCVMNAFAVREIGLCAIKTPEELEKLAKQKTKEYQLVNPIRN
ncbi:hypothetical protein N0V94_000908 [Neodidymelliopsis sp. IMI 364377]|nr:hypothetical protein N0V94_000908 [Neodidymelliopsis sp. IMI 364377]